MRFKLVPLVCVLNFFSLISEHFLFLFLTTASTVRNIFLPGISKGKRPKIIFGNQIQQERVTSIQLALLSYIFMILFRDTPLAHIRLIYGLMAINGQQIKMKVSITSLPCTCQLRRRPFTGSVRELMLCQCSNQMLLLWLGLIDSSPAHALTFSSKHLNFTFLQGYVPVFFKQFLSSADYQQGMEHTMFTISTFWIHLSQLLNSEYCQLNKYPKHLVCLLCFYRTQVYLGSDLWVASVSN